MNSNENLTTIIDRLEKNGASIQDRVRAALNFVQNKNSTHEPVDNADDAAAQPNTQEYDPARSGGDAARSGEHAVKTGDDAAKSAEHPPTSEANPARSQMAALLAARRERSVRNFQRSSDLFEPGLDFRDHLDKRSALDLLPEDQRNAIGELLMDYSPETVQELLAKPQPKGLGVDFSASSLRRFHTRHQRRLNIREQRELHAQIRTLLGEPGASGSAFLNASERLLKIRLFKATADSDTKLDAIAILTRTLNSMRKQALAERKQRHTERKGETSDDTSAASPRAAESAPIPTP
jgi:hypothetical protein